jgi:hypothetical protein
MLQLPLLPPTLLSSLLSIPPRILPLLSESSFLSLRFFLPPSSFSSWTVSSALFLADSRLRQRHCVIQTNSSNRLGLRLEDRFTIPIAHNGRKILGCPEGAYAFRAALLNLLCKDIEKDPDLLKDVQDLHPRTKLVTISLLLQHQSNLPCALTSSGFIRAKTTRI